MRILIYLLLAGILAVLVVSYSLYRRQPSWFQPARLSEERAASAYNELQSLAVSIQDQAGHNAAGQPIELEFTQRQLNEYLQVMPLYVAQAKLPRELADPLIVVRPGRLILAARYTPLGAQPISVHMDLSADDGGVRFAVASIEVGSLPLPQQFIRDQLSELRHDYTTAVERLRTGDKRLSGGAELFIKMGEAFFAALAGEPVTQRDFEYPGADRPMTVRAVELTDGRLRVVLEPQGEPVQRSEVPDWIRQRIEGSGATSRPGGD